MKAIVGLLTPPAIIMATWTIQRWSARKRKRVEKSQINPSDNPNEAK
jgi:hypothetical protein